MRLAASAFVATLLAASTAHAHTRLTEPPPRNNRDDIKASPPCGGVPATTTFRTYREGQSVTLNYLETIGHTGCFVAALVTNGDTQVTSLGPTALQVDPNDTIPAGGRPKTMTIQLPAGVTCERCAIQLRQVMSGTATCDPTTFDEPTYLSCADIRITYADGGVPPAADGGAKADGGADGGASTDGTSTGAGPTTAGNASGDGLGGGGNSAGVAGGNGASSAAGDGQSEEDDSRPSFKTGDAGACSVLAAGGAPASAAGLVFALGALVAVRRRRRHP